MQLRMRSLLRGVSCAAVFLLLGSVNSNAQNLLANPGFEAGAVGGGATGWLTFGNVFTEAAGACEANQALKIFGGFSGGFNVAGAFQEFPASAGEEYVMSVSAQHLGADAMVGPGAPDFNWAVQKIAFFDAGNNEIGSGEGTILDGTYNTDTCYVAPAVNATAPPGTVKVQALILYLQPAFDGGAGFFDAASFTRNGVVATDNVSFGAVKALH